MPTRAITVAHADPVTPIAGAPSLPKISTQLTNRLTMFAAISANITGRTTPMP